MDFTLDKEKALEVIESEACQVGEYDKWEAIIKKIKKEETLNQGELECYTNLTSIYKDSAITSRSKVYHTKLSQQDEKQPYKVCGDDLYTTAI